MGRIGAPFGVQGWVRVQTFSTDPDTLLDFDRWWLRSPVSGPVRPGRRPGSAAGTGAVAAAVPALDAQWREVDVVEAQAHGDGLIAQLAGIGDREEAARLRGTEVGLLRSDLPAPEEGEFYWEDLIGLDAVDPAGGRMGVISGLLEAGAHDVLVIDTPGRTAAGRPVQLLVPFVERHVGEVDLQDRRVVVDWQEPV